MSDAETRLQALAAELADLRRTGHRVARRGGPAPPRRPPSHDPPGPYHGPYGRALADLRTARPPAPGCCQPSAARHGEEAHNGR